MKEDTLSINFVSLLADRDTIWIFWNDYLDNKIKYQNRLDYAEELLRHTWLATNSNHNQHMNSIVCHELEHGLALAKNAGFKTAIIQTPGHVIQHSFIDAIAQFLVDKKWNKKWILAGHILEHKKEPTLWLHEQCFALNLTALSLLDLDPGTILVNRNDKILMPVYTRSDENFHSTYIPLWIKATGKLSQQRPGWGWKWIAKSIVNDGLLIFDKSVRKTKLHMYPEKKENYQTWYRENSASEMYDIISNQANNTNRKLHLFNNEKCAVGMIAKHTHQETFDNIVVPAAGLYGMKMAKQFKATSMIYFDVLQPMLDVTSNINEKWDGITDLYEFVDNIDHVFSKSHVMKVDTFNESIFKSSADVQHFLPKFRHCNFRYELVDVISDPELFVSIIPTKGSTYIWLNGIYTYHHNFWKYRPREIEDSYRHVMSELKTFPNDIWVHVKDPTGHIRIINVKEFNLNITVNTLSSTHRTWS